MCERTEAAQVCQPTQVAERQPEPKRNKVKSLIIPYSCIVWCCQAKWLGSIDVGRRMHAEDDDDIQPEGIRTTNEANY